MHPISRTNYRIMKLYILLGSLFFADAALTQDQQNNAKAVFNKLDSDDSGSLTSGGVYGALEQLDKDLTENELQKAAGHGQEVSLDEFMKIYAKIENKGGAGEYPEGCENWFDGCNHCIIKDGKELGCTKMFCGQINGQINGPKKGAFCTVFTDGRRCTSATSCGGAKQYNCFTREVWAEDKKKYCCKEKKMGCPQKQQRLFPVLALSGIWVPDSPLLVPINNANLFLVVLLFVQASSLMRCATLSMKPTLPLLLTARTTARRVSIVSSRIPTRLVSTRS